MPKSGSQIPHCNLPVRYDTYEGCSHACSYCFVKRKNTLAVVDGESVSSLRKFIEGARNQDTNWCDWDIPLHWGGMSDPFQPVELERKRSLEALKVFAETQYPFVVSTKSNLVAQEPYLSLIKLCNCVVQFSALCPEYDQYEKGASSFKDRLIAAAAISQYKRVIIRLQPYIPQIFLQVQKSLQIFKECGVYGVTIEGMKYVTKRPGTIRLGNDFVYPEKLLLGQFVELRKKCHSLGLRFYCAENRLRYLGDSLCCCGIEGLGWRENTANLNSYLYDKKGFVFSEAQMKSGTAGVFRGIHQQPLYNKWVQNVSYFDAMLREVSINSLVTKRTKR